MYYKITGVIFYWRNILKVFFSLVFLFVFCDINLEGRSKFFNQNIDVQSNKNRYLDLFPDHKKEIDEIFRDIPFYTNVQFHIDVKKKVLHKMFTEVDFSLAKAGQYGFPIYQMVIEKQDNITYKVTEGDSLSGTIKELLVNEKDNRYIFLIDGRYDGLLIIRGKMLVEIKFRNIEGQQYVEAKQYITLSNDVLWNTAKRLTIFQKIGEKVDRLITSNINRIVRTGKGTALAIQKEFDEGKLK